MRDVKGLLEEIARSEGSQCDPSPRLYTPQRRKMEISSSGIDEYKQTRGTDGLGTITATGLRIPTLATTNTTAGLRYLFQLATIKLGVGRRIIVRGMRQLLTIGLNNALEESAPYIMELPITTSNWSYQDGNVAWSLRRVAPRSRPLYNAQNSDNFIYRFSDTSSAGALLFENATFPALDVSPSGRPIFYTQLTDYTPPNGGNPYGQALDGQLSTFRDIRFPWETSHAWDSLHIPVEGPCSVVLFASVLQTDPQTRPTTKSFNTSAQFGLPEEVFSEVFANSIYWRIGGSLIFEEA